MSADLSRIFSRMVDANDYVDSIEEPFRQKSHAIKQNYVANAAAIESLRKIADDHVIVAFSAVWCKDCISNTPVLAITEDDGHAGQSLRRHQERPTESHMQMTNPAITVRNAHIRDRQAAGRNRL